jgi:hypothetical protein
MYKLTRTGGKKSVVTHQEKPTRNNDAAREKLLKAK